MQQGGTSGGLKSRQVYVLFFTCCHKNTDPAGACVHADSTTEAFEDFWSPNYVRALSLVRDETSFQQSLDKLRYADLHGVEGATCCKDRIVPEDVEELLQRGKVRQLSSSALVVCCVSSAGMFFSSLRFKWGFVLHHFPFESEGGDNLSST